MVHVYIRIIHIQKDHLLKCYYTILEPDYSEFDLSQNYRAAASQMILSHFNAMLVVVLVLDYSGGL